MFQLSGFYFRALLLIPQSLFCYRVRSALGLRAFRVLVFSVTDLGCA